MAASSTASNLPIHDTISPVPALSTQSDHLCDLQSIRSWQRSRTSFTAATINCHGRRNVIDRLNRAHEAGIDVVCLQETHAFQATDCPPDWWGWCNPGSSHAAGVMIAIHTSMIERLTVTNKDEVTVSMSNRAICVQLNVRSVGPVAVISLYAPVSNAADRLVFFRATMRQLVTPLDNTSIIMLGDFNATAGDFDSLEGGTVKEASLLPILESFHDSTRFLLPRTPLATHFPPEGRRQLNHRSKRLDYCFVRCVHGVPLDHQECSLQPTRVAFCPQDDDKLIDHVWVVTKLQFAATYKLPTSEWRAAPDSGVRDDPEVFRNMCRAAMKFRRDFGTDVLTLGIYGKKTYVRRHASCTPRTRRRHRWQRSFSAASTTTRRRR